MTGPDLYDDGPEQLHTSAPRRRTGLLVVLLGGTVLLALVAVVLLLVVRGSPTEQAEESVGVFLAALDQGDGETAHALLCEDVRAEFEPGRVPAEYEQSVPGEVVGSTERDVDGAPVVEVEVRWADGGTSEIVVVNEGGPHVCSNPAAG
jgi:hypothetical protein